jgi:preprotein translocase subunit YajC
MSFLNFLAMASPEGASGSGSGLMTFLMFGSVFAIFWFMILRPQKKQQDQRKAMIEALKRGDKIITSGGLFATVRDVKNDRVVATIGDNIKVEIAKHAINGVLESEEA